MKMTWNFPSLLASATGHVATMVLACLAAHCLGTVIGFFLAAPSWEAFVGLFHASWLILFSPLLMFPSLLTGWGLLFYLPMAPMLFWAFYDDEAFRRWLAVGGIFLLAGGDAFRMAHMW